MNRYTVHAVVNDKDISNTSWPGTSTEQRIK